jgi:hypothetical protein
MDEQIDSNILSNYLEIACKKYPLVFNTFTSKNFYGDIYITMDLIYKKYDLGFSIKREVSVENVCGFININSYYNIKNIILTYLYGGYAIINNINIIMCVFDKCTIKFYHVSNNNYLGVITKLVHHSIDSKEDIRFNIKLNPIINE